MVEAMYDETDKPLILIIDDDTAMRFMARETLEVEGFEVVEAQDGREGVECFEEHQPDLVLLDLIMPVKDGFQACRDIRRTMYGKRVPIMVMTSLDDTESITQAYDSGATDFITKPIEYLILGQRVRYILRASNAMEALLKSEQNLAHAQKIARIAHWEWHSKGSRYYIPITY